MTYTFQIFATCLLGREADSEVSPFYADQLEFFLRPGLWESAGILTALTPVIRVHCRKTGRYPGDRRAPVAWHANASAYTGHLHVHSAVFAW
jgi:hypothetical protein